MCLPEFAWRFEQIDPCELLIPLVSFETENKPVLDLLLLRTGLILLRSLFFFTPPNCDRTISSILCLNCSSINSMMKIRTRISENCSELVSIRFNSLFWKLRVFHCVLRVLGELGKTVTILICLGEEREMERCFW
jgi:hypothetical protein